MCDHVALPFYSVLPGTPPCGPDTAERDSASLARDWLLKETVHRPHCSHQPLSKRDQRAARTAQKLQPGETCMTPRQPVSGRQGLGEARTGWVEEETTDNQATAQR